MKLSKVLIGIDVGTTVLKAAAFDAVSGEPRAVASRPLPLVSPKPEWRETPVERIDTALRSALIHVQSELPSRGCRIAGVGVAAQGGSSIIVDRRTGQALSPMILWNDNRAATLEDPRPLRPEAWWRRRMLNNWTPAGLRRFAWLAREWPQLCEDPSTLFSGAGDYVYHHLTGTWRQDAGSALQIGTYTPATGRLDGPLFSLCGLDATRFAPLRDGHTPTALHTNGARRFGLPEGVPVAGPYMDQEAALYSVLGTSRSPLQVSLGTAWVGTFVLPRRRLGFAGMQLALVNQPGDQAIVILPLLTGNPAWNWALRLVDRRPGVALRKAAHVFEESLLPPRGVACIPWFAQTNTAQPGFTGAGLFSGLPIAATPADIVRAVALGLCCELRRVFDAVKTGNIVDSVVLSGGAAKAAHFRALIATLFRPLPVFVQENVDTAAARGALVAFGRNMSRSPVARVRAEVGKLAAAIDEAYDVYMRTYGSYYANHPLGVAYTVPPEPR